MAKKQKKKEAASGGGGLFPEVEQIIALLSSESQQELVILAVPSHDRANKLLNDVRVKEWASNAMSLFADLYGGATAFETFAGIYKTDAGEYLHDKPILVQSYGTIEAIEQLENLNELLRFCKRMGKELNQDSIMLVIGEAMIYISDYSGVD